MADPTREVAEAPAVPSLPVRIAESIGFEGPATEISLANRLQVPLPVLRSALYQMESDGRIECNPKGEYVVPV